MVGVHLLLGDAALPVGLIRLGAPVNPEAALGLGELVVFFLGAVRQDAGLWGRLLGLSLLAEGATDVALHGSAVLQKMLHLPPWNGQGDSSAFLKCSRRAVRPWGYGLAV